jgi:hypothetical protein
MIGLRLQPRIRVETRRRWSCTVGIGLSLGLLLSRRTMALRQRVQRLR